MKNPAFSIQFTGYPLALAPKLQDPNNINKLEVEKTEDLNDENDIQINKTINDPDTWDEEWFNNYE